jgi:hypothetical protein
MNRVQSQTEAGRAGEAPPPPLSLLARESAAPNSPTDAIRLFFTPAREDSSRVAWEEFWGDDETEVPGAVVFQSNPLSD